MQELYFAPYSNQLKLNLNILRHFVFYDQLGFDVEYIKAYFLNYFKYNIIKGSQGKFNTFLNYEILFSL